MGNDQRGVTSCELSKRTEHRLLSVTVETRSGLVKNEYRRVFKDCAGNGDTLALTPRQFESALADGGVQAVV